jgi:hypothetical protein
MRLFKDFLRPLFLALMALKACGRYGDAVEIRQEITIPDFTKRLLSQNEFLTLTMRLSGLLQRSRKRQSPET